MSYWDNNIEKMEEIISKNLPPIWKVLLMNDEVTLDEIPAEVKMLAFRKGEPDYWGNKIDEAEMRLEDR